MTYRLWLAGLGAPVEVEAGTMREAIEQAEAEHGATVYAGTAV